MEEDQKIVEFLIACSLLNVNASVWLRSDLNIKNIFVLPTPGLDRRWKPHVACSLEPVDPKDEDYDVILSFGLLLMEIEAKRFARPKAVDKDWETDLYSKDSMLKRILQEWSREVGDGYIQVATACLRFRELSARFYDPTLTQNMKETAAIYRYILAPLYRIITQQHSKISALFRSFPSPLQSSSATQSRLRRQATSSSRWHLFDDFILHDQRLDSKLRDLI